MSTAEDAFLSDIRASPDEEVRLTYADWLKENGQPLSAEPIRLQVELTPRHQPHRTVPNPLSADKQILSPELFSRRFFKNSDVVQSSQEKQME